MVIGVLSAGWYHLARMLHFHGTLGVMILMVIPFLVTGGIHLDGFLDTTDALSSWMPKEKRLAILKDVHVGAFAVLFGIVYMFLMYGGYSEITKRTLPFLCLAFPFSRVLSAWTVVSFPKAKKDGTVATFAKDAGTKQVQKVLIIYGVILAALMLVINPLFGALELITGALVFVWYYKMVMKQFGGVTGDTAGYFLCILELMIVLVLGIAKAII